MKIRIISVIFAALISNAVFADQVCQSTSGALYCGKGTINSLPKGVYGKVSLNGTVVTDTTTAVTGYFRAKDFKGDNIEVVAGSTNLSDSEITGKNVTFTSGFMSANKTKFIYPITLNSPDISFSDITTVDISVNSEDPHKKLILILKGKSIVSGNINFNNNHGIVCVEDTAKIKGQVIGGSIHSGTCIFDNLD